MKIEIESKFEPGDTVYTVTIGRNNDGLMEWMPDKNGYKIDSIHAEGAGNGATIVYKTADRSVWISSVYENNCFRTITAAEEECDKRNRGIQRRYDLIDERRRKIEEIEDKIKQIEKDINNEYKY